MDRPEVEVPVLSILTIHFPFSTQNNLKKKIQPLVFRVTGTYNYRLQKINVLVESGLYYWEQFLTGKFEKDHSCFKNPS